MHHLDCIDVHHLEPSDFVSLDSESVPMIPSVIPYIYIYPSHLEAKAIWSGTNCLTNGSLAVKSELFMESKSTKEVARMGKWKTMSRAESWLIPMFQ